MEGRSIEVEAAISDALPMAVLLGTDIPELPELLQGGQSKKIEGVFAVTTRAAKKKQQEEAEEHHRRERVCGVQPSAIGLETSTTTEGSGEASKPSASSLEAGTTTERCGKASIWMSELDEDLLSGGRTRVQQSRREKKRRMQLESVVDVEEDKEKKEGNNEDRQELKILQATDPSLGEVRMAVKVHESTEGVGLFYKDDLLFRRWVPHGRDKKEMAVDQLVPPAACRSTVMSLAHSIPLAGHLGKKKTTDRVLQHFYWPTIHRDIAEYCRTCESCQKCSGRKGVRAPLIPLPIISQPFERY